MAFMPEYIAYDDAREGWVVRDHDGCSLEWYDTPGDALDAVRESIYPHLEMLLASGCRVITLLEWGCPFPQKFQDCLGARWMRH